MCPIKIKNGVIWFVGVSYENIGVIWLVGVPYQSLFFDKIKRNLQLNQSRFKSVLDEIKYFNADDIVSYYFNHNDVRYKDIYIDLMNCWFGLEDTKF